MESQLFDSQIKNTDNLPIDNRSTAFVSTKFNPEQAKLPTENNALRPTRGRTPDLDASPRAVTPLPSSSPSPIFKRKNLRDQFTKMNSRQHRIKKLNQKYQNQLYQYHRIFQNSYSKRS